MRFEWDPEKARRNRAKHGIDFKLAERVWDDPLHVVTADPFEGGEQRWRAIGQVGPVVLLVVAHTYRGSGEGEVIRIINARKATRYERKQYEQEAI